mgnify:CR=1 FL=1
MYVVIGVAAMAGGGQIFLHHAIGMAGATGQFRVVMAQREIGSIVVEYVFVPAIHRVATIALLAVFPGVDIRRFVATDAGGFLKLITLAGMAARAGNLCMQAAQVETGGGVVKLFARLPALGGVTGFALRTQRFFMEIIFFVAVHALGFGIAKFLALFVTAIAGERRVFALQGKARPLVAEGIDRHSDDVRIAPQVIGVASVTGFDAGLG